ncbi:hypothetical protein AAG570_010136, partial [Ranatra chinensis]
ASIETPGNIPVVLSAACQLYQTQAGGYQEEVSLPLGMVVNAVFKNQSWLYVQTPHGEEGYVRYASCLPLGILPPQHDTAPCWESHSDIFPKPVGTRSECGRARSECGGGSKWRTGNGSGVARTEAVANTRLKAATRQTLLVISKDYQSTGPSTLTVAKGDVVALISSKVKDWFWVRDRRGQEGFIPAAVAGHGFL